MAEKADELKTHDEKIAQAKELYSRGSRNYLVKCYSEAADDLSQVCGLYEELYGPLCDELGMPYLLYAKSLLSLDENKVIDVPDEDDDDDDDEDGEEVQENGANKESIDSSNLATIPEEESEESNLKKNDSEEQATKSVKENNKENSESSKSSEKDILVEKKDDEKDKEKENEKENDKENAITTGKAESTSSTDFKNTHSGIEGQAGTSNGNVATEEDTNEDADEIATNLQVAWETLELAHKIFERQGESALLNLAEVKTELGNIQFENNVLDAAREDYNNALDIYKKFTKNYRRAMAEIHYKIGLTYLMQEQQSSKESAESLKQACKLLDDEINELKSKTDSSDQDKVNIEDMEETQQEIWLKITEIEDTHQQCIAEVRAALDSYISPSKDPEMAGPSSSSSTDKPAKDISHLIKRKKPENSNDNEGSPAKRPTL